MKAAQLLRLTRRNLAKNRRTLLISAFGVALGIGTLVFFLALGRGLGQAVAQVFPEATRELEVVLPQLAVGNLLGADRKLDDQAVAQLAKLPGVEHAWPKMALRIPALSRYNGQFFGKELHMGLELIGVGMPPESLAEDLKGPFLDPGAEPGKPIPIVINRRFLEIYNKVFAPQRGLPKLTESMITGFTFPVELGASWVAARALPNAQPTSMRLVGFSDRATIAGITMPLASVMRVNALFGVDATSYSSVLLSARSSGEVSGLAERVKQLGYELDESERSRALQIGASVRVATLALALLAALITLLSTLNIAQSFFSRVRERRREIGVLRAVGATRSDVLMLFLSEAAATGLIGGLVGASSARLLGRLLNHLARTRLPDFPFKPHSFFAFAPWMFIAGIALAVLSALFGAWLPARKAARLDPARALTD